MTKYNEGDEIIVTVGGRKFTTVITDGVQRYKANTAVEAFVNASGEAYEVWIRTDRSTPEPFSLNTLIMEYFNGKHTLDDMLTLYTSFGYSVSGMMDVSIFSELDVRNPLWEDEHYAKLSSKAFEELMGLINEPYRHNGDEAVRFVFDAVSDGKWKVNKGDLVNGTDTIDRVVLGFLGAREIEPWDIEVKEDTSDELKGFLKHLS